MAMGHFVPRALALAAKLGIADLLKDGPRSARDLAVATQTHAPSLAHVVRLLASVGVFSELPDGTFSLTPLGKPRARTPNSVRHVGAAVRRRRRSGLLEGPRVLRPDRRPVCFAAPHPPRTPTP